ncbi:hypothetical protein ACFL1B_03150 [Nanoarchaeota archaeon]
MNKRGQFSLMVVVALLIIAMTGVVLLAIRQVKEDKSQEATEEILFGDRVVAHNEAYLNVIASGTNAMIVTYYVTYNPVALTYEGFEKGDLFGENHQMSVTESVKGQLFFVGISTDGTKSGRGSIGIIKFTKMGSENYNISVGPWQFYDGSASEITGIIQSPLDSYNLD